MKRHAAMSAEIIRPIEFLKDVVPMVLHHHEWYNGSGYPDGLAGDDIPLGARILCVADSLEAMTSDRPYRKGMSLREGAYRLKDGSGMQFEPRIVDAMLEVVDRIEFIENFDELSEFENFNDNPPAEFKDAV
jgi:HD-GYP domain-containing protein (c-di-GMP phosphodiesterase class II)